MRLQTLVETSRQVAESHARRDKIARLAACLTQLPDADIGLGVALLMGALPQGRLGIGRASLRELSADPAPTAALTLAELMAALDSFGTLRGKGAKDKKRAALTDLFGRATAPEQRFLHGLLLGELRQGALEGVLTEAVATATGVSLDALRRAAMLRGDLAEVATVAQTEGEAGLVRFRIEPMRPLTPMLAQSTETLEQSLNRFGVAMLEDKLDGVRVQVHRAGDEVRVFTRRLHDITARVPEVVTLAKAMAAQAFVLDGEAMAVRADGRPHPFQVTMRRLGSRGDAKMAELPVTAFFFDCLHLEGVDQIDRPAQIRAEVLASTVPAVHRVRRVVTSRTDHAQDFMQQALNAGHEGIMVKDPLAPYEAGRRGAGWLKIKRTNTVDLVVIAVEWGSGRRAGLLSNIHLGARDPGSGGFVPVGKTFKGMTDAMLRWQTARFLDLERARDEHVVMLRPEQVVEVAFDGVQASPQYAGGLALRFARVKRYREDKAASEADTIETLRGFLAS